MGRREIEALQDKLLVALQDNDEQRQVDIIEQLNEMVIKSAQRKVGRVMEVKFWAVKE